ncbi:hypothetical protein ACFQ3C_01500 [Seohaeicola saemankumensis]|uniref:Uncharacterized protein n=1 Tax=Seohaeicola saemankumensis TaxID=481181 RepID=A0ABW3T831_9RHOB
MRIDEHFEHCAKAAQKPVRNALSEYANPKHKAATRSLGYALTLGDEASWRGLIIVLMSRLTIEERAALAFSTLRSMGPDEAAMTAKAALEEATAGMPIAAFDGVISEAAFWADLADPDELDAYCLACFNRMAPARQAAFLSFVQRRAVA